MFSSNKSITLICACKNRNQPLQIALTSWLLRPEITEIVIVDWNSDEALSSLTKLDSKIKVITVPNQKYFNHPQPLNLAASIATGDYILKVDCDYILNPYFNFFDFYTIDSNSFVCGENDYEEIEINSSPYFKYLRGLLFITIENYLKVGGYNEINMQYYGYEDDEIVHRLELLGLKKKKICYNHHLFHIPHQDKKRIENFEGYNSRQVENIKNTLCGDENTKQWNAEYILTMEHIEQNKQIAPLTDEYYVRPQTQWNIQQIDEQNYYANQIMNNKLENFPSVYYVSLEECKDRQDNIERQFAEYGITPTAILSKRFAESDDEIVGKYSHTLNDGTKGCVVSHLKAIRKWYEETDEDYAFFCEDDLSLKTIEHWEFTWEEFIKTLPEDAECVQLLTIRSNFDTFELRERYWDDWGATAYIITRDYSERMINKYIINGVYNLELDNDIQPLIENILFTNSGKSYTIPLFVEEVKFQSTFVGKDNDVKDGQKNNHYKSRESVLNYWKNNQKMKSFTITKQEEPKDFAMNQIEYLLTEYSNDPENAEHNFNLGVWYWNEGHTAPALSYFLRCSERAEDLLAYEALLWAHQCYEKQGTRDSTARTLLQHAINLLPTRPEAYFLLAKFHSKREQWTDAYSVSHQGLTFLEKNIEPLRNSVGYMGEFALLYEKAVAGWWWGKSNEARDILQYIQNNYELPEQYEKLVQDLLMNYGVGNNLKKIDENIQNKLSDIFDIQRHQTDKTDLGYIEHFYNDFFIKLKNNPIIMLEIGVYNGGSIQLWKDYLHSESKIYAGDVNYFNHIEGTCSVIGDMYSGEQVSKFSDDYFDLIIDDGPHTFESFVILMQKYYSKIKSQGTLIIEDIIQTNWVKPLSELSYVLGYSNCEIIEMTGKQKTDELLNRWKEGLYILNITK